MKKEEVFGSTLIEMLKKESRIIDRDDFNASGAIHTPQHKFDFIYSHSVMSHASMSQLRQYVTVVSESLAPGGVSFASLCLCFPCEDVSSRRKYDLQRDFPPSPKTLRDTDLDCMESLVPLRFLVIHI